MCTRYNIKFNSDLGQVGGFLRVLRFPPPIKLTVWNCSGVVFLFFILLTKYFYTFITMLLARLCFGLSRLTPLSTVFQLYRGGKF
jgi:hypothetical protein